ncbi:MAG: acylphosphatase [Desulfatitalea sp.]|nr:acylphosphatase [Desulfatitalea sp.]
MDTNVRAHVIISGRVQGVFFRAETVRAAERLGVSGWVRNRNDGRVEALFEGPQTAVNDAIAWCHHGSPQSRVTGVEVTWETYQGDTQGFSARR